MLQPIPSTIQKYFWGDSISDLSWLQHKTYITQTLLERGNTDAIHWLFDQISRDELRQLLPTLKLQKKSSNFWNLYLS